jgi:hypothetical protein
MQEIKEIIRAFELDDLDIVEKNFCYYILFMTLLVVLSTMKYNFKKLFWKRGNAVFSEQSLVNFNFL